MHRIDTPTAQVDKFGAGKNGFTRGKPQTGVPATALDDDYFDAIQEEIAKVIESTGAVLNKADRTQLLTAINLIISGSSGNFLKKANNLSEIKNAGSAAIAEALANLTLTTMGIGLPTQATMSNFDWQNFIFISGANYQTNYTSWLNTPLGLDFTVGIGANITVDYVTSNATRIGLTVIPDTGTQNNYRVFKVLAVGAPGARVFTVRQEWNSAIAVPISGGGTGTTTVANALINLGLGQGSLVPIDVPFPYPLATAPANFLKVNGSSFSTTAYPLLAAVYPSGVLPDLRGYAIEDRTMGGG